MTQVGLRMLSGAFDAAESTGYPYRTVRYAGAGSRTRDRNASVVRSYRLFVRSQSNWPQATGCHSRSHVNIKPDSFMWALHTNDSE
eukprot:scaffold175152_cov31-Prasinocladus_malaysianus.AAC.2